MLDFNEYLINESLTKSIDLQAEFKILNKKLFNNELEPIDIIWNNTKAVRGVFTYAITKRGRHKTILYDKRPTIKISKFFLVDKEDILCTLAHEMVHYWVWSNRIIDGDHGVAWQKKVREINALGIVKQITQYNQTPIGDVGIAVNKVLKTPKYIIEATYNGVVNTMIVSSIKEYPTLDGLYDFFKVFYKRIYKAEITRFVIMTTTDANILKFPQQRNLVGRSISSYKDLKDSKSYGEQYTEIVSKANILKQY